jgi:hypothetical protein
VKKQVVENSEFTEHFESEAKTAGWELLEDVDPSGSTAKMGTNHLGIRFRVPQKNWLPH